MGPKITLIWGFPKILAYFRTSFHFLQTLTFLQFFFIRLSLNPVQVLVLGVDIFNPWPKKCDICHIKNEILTSISPPQSASSPIFDIGLGSWIGLTFRWYIWTWTFIKLGFDNQKPNYIGFWEQNYILDTVLPTGTRRETDYRNIWQG